METMDKIEYRNHVWIIYKDEEILLILQLNIKVYNPHPLWRRP